MVAARRYRARHTLSGAARPFAHPRRRRHAATTVLRVPDDSNYHLVARSHALSCCWDRAREPRKPREFCFQPKPSFDRPHRPHEHGVALSVRKVLYGYGTHGVCILEPPQTSCRNFLRCQAAVALTTPPHAAQSRRARTARVRHVLRRGAAAYGDAYQALLGARMQERTFLSRP